MYRESVKITTNIKSLYQKITTNIKSLYQKITTNIKSQFEIMAKFGMILAHKIPTTLIIAP